MSLFIFLGILLPSLYSRSWLVNRVSVPVKFNLDSVNSNAARFLPYIAFYMWAPFTLLVNSNLFGGVFLCSLFLSPQYQPSPPAHCRKLCICMIARTGIDWMWLSKTWPRVMLKIRSQDLASASVDLVGSFAPLKGWHLIDGPTGWNNFPRDQLVKPMTSRFNYWREAIRWATKGPTKTGLKSRKSIVFVVAFLKGACSFHLEQMPLSSSYQLNLFTQRI